MRAPIFPQDVSGFFSAKKLWNRNTLVLHERDFFPPIRIIFDQCCCHKITEKINFCFRESPGCVEYYITSVFYICKVRPLRSFPGNGQMKVEIFVINFTR